MQFSENYGGVPTVGLEYEMASWQPKNTMFTAAKALVDNQYMLPGTGDPYPYTSTRHDYHCGCVLCSMSERMNYPPLWKMQRDASLPSEGAEFISSPFPAARIYVDEALEAINILQSLGQSIAGMKVDNERQNGFSETGFHIHVRPHTEESTIELGNKFNLLINTLNAFCPEMFAIAQLEIEKPRSLTYRIPEVYSIIGGGPRNQHHSWLNFVSKSPLRLEFRLWETPFDNLEYYRRAILFSAGLSQLVLNSRTCKQLWSFGLAMPWEEDILKPKTQLNLSNLLDVFSRERFTSLCEMIIQYTAVGEDTESINLVRATEAAVLRKVKA